MPAVAASAAEQQHLRAPPAHARLNTPPLHFSRRPYPPQVAWDLSVDAEEEGGEPKVEVVVGAASSACKAVGEHVHSSSVLSGY
jgi:hypothetical protein